ncbi:hydrogenase 4 subunit B [Acidimangrovimonas pyrenivorans]|uniref:Hydrogenase 4 subunit B n=1 Tax=Acidimangrovimonas pyrenivorans TaxID=2030798 RepID=A0ABV7AIP1_9RHOB
MLTELAALCVAALLTLSAAAVVLPANPRSSALLYGATSLPSLGAALIGLAQLAGGQASGLVLPLGLPWLGAHLRLDALAAFFLLVIGIGGAAASLYAIGYGRDEPEPGRTLPFFPGFIGAMLLVVLADDAFTFLMSWEVMSLLSWALVLTRHREDQTRSAATLYLTMAAAGTMSLLLAFGLLAGSGAYAFETIRATPHSPLIATAILGLMLVGAGSKAGLAPLHLWLPEAHPAAPSHVSALMSGVMTKVAVYGFLRVVFDLAGPLPWWASAAVILIGAGTAVLGILNALMADDSKRALAYSTIENIGVIFAALGLALAFRANGMEAAAALALSAALFHIFNHMAFKSLLFMGAGAVLHATGTRALDRLGGLIHRMPVTSALTLIGVTAISALPPLNGFASEWLVFQSVLKSPDLPQPVLQIIVPAAGGLLALAAALAAAAFVRLYGLAFLGRPRSPEAETAHEVDRFMLTAMGALAALCVIAGIVPALVLDRLAPAAELLTTARLPLQSGQPWLTLVPIAEARSTYNPLLVFAFIAVTGWAAAWAAHRFGSRALRRGPAWDCGFPNADPATQYGAGSFAQPLRRVLGPVLLRASEEVEMPPPGDSRPARHRVTSHDVIRETLYQPLTAAVWRIATVANRLQFLTIRRYLSLVMGALVGLLLVLALWQ